MIHYEREPIDGKNQTAKGQVVCFEEEDIMKIAPRYLYLFQEPLTDKSILQELKKAVREHEEKHGVVFWSPEETQYRYTLSRTGKLKSFSVNYRSIN